MPEKKKEVFLTTKQAAKRLKVKPQAIRDAINAGVIRAVMSGGRYQIPQRQIDQTAKINGELAKVGHFVSVKQHDEKDSHISRFRLATIVAVKSMEEIVVEFIDTGLQKTISTKRVAVQQNTPTYRYRWPGF